jgi:hypothetical protein
MLLFGRRKGLPIGIITGVPASVDNRFVPGSGVGGINHALRRYLSRKATKPKQTTSTTTATSVGSLSFNGTTSNLLYSGIIVGSNAFTFECFFYPTDLTGRNVIFGANYTTPANGELSIAIISSTQLNIDRLGVSSISYTVPTIQLNTWNHFAFVRDALNNETVFLNGTRSTTGTVTDAYVYKSTRYIGAWNSGGTGLSNFFTGNLSGVRVVVGSTTYNPLSSTITVPTQPLSNITNTVLLLNTPYSVNYMVDSSISNVTFTNTNVVSSAIYP